jgi:single-stranded-DNA-specific exonuclease
VLRKFGGHAMAAGCTIEAAHFEVFDAAFRQVAAEWLDAATLSRTLRADGALQAEWFTPDTVALLDGQVWGQGFEAPLFCDEVDVVTQRLVGEKHLKLQLRHAGVLREAIWFGRTEPLPDRARVAYRLSVDAYNGRRRLQMVVEAVD